MTEKMLTIGSRAQVWHGTAKKTSGGLTRTHLMMNKSGRIVSKAKHNTAKKENRLLKHGYGTKKGKFGFVKIGTRKNRKGKKGGSVTVNGTTYTAPQIPPGDMPAELFSNRTGMKGGDMNYHGGPIMAGGSGMGELSPAGANDSYMIKNVEAQQFSPLDRALVGGRRRRKMRGGSAYGSGLFPADVNGSYMIKDVEAQQFSPLDRALVGGRRRRKMRGGTGKQTLMPMELNNTDPLARALAA